MPSAAGSTRRAKRATIPRPVSKRVTLSACVVPIPTASAIEHSAACQDIATERDAP